MVKFKVSFVNGVFVAENGRAILVTVANDELRLHDSDGAWLSIDFAFRQKGGNRRA